MEKVSKIWMQLAGLPSPKSKPRKYDRAKRTKKQLYEFAESLGLTLKPNWIQRDWGVLDADGDDIHNQYGSQGPCPNLYYLEWCLEDYLEDNAHKFTKS